MVILITINGKNISRRSNWRIIKEIDWSRVSTRKKERRGRRSDKGKEFARWMIDQ